MRFNLVASMNKTPKTTRPDAIPTESGFVRDISEKGLPADLLAILLQDRSTGRNILWATEGYGFAPDSEVFAAQVTAPGEPLIRPRVDKTNDVQQYRIKKRAEVFTPSWLCKEMLDEPSAEMRRESGWKDYIREPVLEVTCGEAPFLASRYDAISGELIPVSERIGVLDRKLLAISRFCRENGWLSNALAAVRATYGFEWQGDNLLIARENILASVVEHYWWRWARIECTDIAEFPHQDFLREVAEAISWNLWQMDGLKFVVPMSCHDVEQTDLFGNVTQTPCEGCKKKKHGVEAADSGPYDGYVHNGTPCRIILDWYTREEIRFVDVIREGRQSNVCA